MLDGHSYRRDRIRIGRRRRCHIGDRHYRAFRSSPLLSSHNNHRRMARFALLPQKQRRSAATRQSAISWTASLFSCPLSGAKQKYPEAPKFRLLAHQENKPTQLKRPWVWCEKTITFSAPTPPSFNMGQRAAHLPSPWEPRPPHITGSAPDVHSCTRVRNRIGRRRRCHIEDRHHRESRNSLSVQVRVHARSDSLRLKHWTQRRRAVARLRRNPSITLTSS